MVDMHPYGFFLNTMEGIVFLVLFATGSFVAKEILQIIIIVMCISCAFSAFEIAWRSSFVRNHAHAQCDNTDLMSMAPPVITISSL